MKEIKTLLIRADASNHIGTGHIMRCLALAQAWTFEGGKAYFCINEDLPVALDRRLEAEGMQRVTLQKTLTSQEDAQNTLEYCQKYNIQWVILDGYHFNSAYQQIIKKAGLQLLVIDDYGHINSYCADLVLNQNIYAHTNLYPNVAKQTRLLLGGKYALLRREFWKWRDEPRYKLRESTSRSPLRILITLGGSDPNNVTLTVLTALKYLDLKRIEAKVIVGGSNPHLDLLKSACDRLGDSVSLHSNVANMPDLMTQSDLAISAGGSTCWELAFMGIPSLLIVLAENQKLIAETLDCANIGINLGWYQNITPDIIVKKITNLLENREFIIKMSQKALKLVDGYGSHRTISVMKTLSCKH
jgi:UDP-2,4-diacetamido-2,4,6-trideoxy-beta-L-altropyranose hydrolase